MKASVAMFLYKRTIKRILKQLHEMGGCDADTDYDKGWDDAITAVIEMIQDTTGIKEGEWLE